MDIGVLKVITTLPLSGAKDVATDSLIQLKFNTDIDIKSITGGVAVMCEGDDTNVKGALSYDKNRTITFKPAVPLKPNVAYLIIVKDTIKNILGNSCQRYDFSFTTRQTSELTIPMTVFPSDSVMVKDNPTFQWYSTKNADGYNIELSESDSFSMISWKTTVNAASREIDDKRLVSATPDIMLKENALYYWRVQAFQSSELKIIYGPLTEVYRFSVSRDVTSVIAPDDEPYIDPAYIDDDNTPPVPEVSECFPEIGFSNTGNNIKTLYARVKGILDPFSFDPRDWFCVGEHVTQNPNYPVYNKKDTSQVLAPPKVQHGEVKGSWSVVVDSVRKETIIIFQPVAL